MNLMSAIKTFVAIKRSVGLKYDTNAAILKHFQVFMGDVSLGAIRDNDVVKFAHEPGSSPKTIRTKFFAIGVFFNWAADRGYIAASPIYSKPPHMNQDFMPYIYQKDEIKNILYAASRLDNKSSPLQGKSFRTILLTIYACGLRLSEATALRINDVDFAKNTILISDTKFRKSRILPICDDLCEELFLYLKLRKKLLPCPQKSKSAFFSTRTGNAFFGTHVAHLFRKIRKDAGLDFTYRKTPPRIHDLRHTFAVHRLMDWYRQNMDVQYLLPALSTYLGHTDIEDTKYYLTMTNELLQLVSQKFESYIMTEK